MSDYIDRAALGIGKANPNVFENKDYVNGWNSAIDIIMSAPAAYIPPMRHERWDDSGRYTFLDGKTAVRCTGCGACLAEEEYKKNVWNFCPVCGAKMDKTEDRA